MSTERVWTIEITENLIMNVESSPVLRVFGTREYAEEVCRFLAKANMSNVLTEDGLAKHYGFDLSI